MILVYTITLPKSSGWKAQPAFHLMEQLLYACNTLVFRIKATSNRMEWQIMDLVERAPEGMRTAIQATYPEAEVHIGELPPYAHHDAAFERVVISYHPALPEFVAPIQHVDKLGDADPLAAITQTMAALQPGEQMIYSLFVTGLLPDAYREGEKLITRKVYDGTLFGTFFPQKVDRYIPEHQRVFRDKLQRPLYQTYLMIQIDTPYPERLASLLAIDSQTVLFDDPDFNGIRWHGVNNTIESVTVTDANTDLLTSALGTYLAFGATANQTNEALKRRQATRFVFEPRELAALWHLPNRHFQAETIAWAKTAHVPMPSDLVGKQRGVRLGNGTIGQRSVPVYLADPDRATHIAIIGKTGAGKSTQLHNLIHQDIVAGRGLVFLDPHGTTVKAILRTSIPKERVQDVVVLDVMNTAYPPPLNILRFTKGGEVSLAASQVVSLIEQMTGRLADTPRVADTLTQAILTLWTEPYPTIMDVGRLFTDPVYRNRLVSRSSNLAVKEFWGQFERLSPQQQEQLSYPVIYRMRSFYGNETVLPIMCHPEGLDFAALLAQRKIILISLAVDDNRIPGQQQVLVGAALIASIQRSVALQPSQGITTLYIDEAERFVTAGLPEVFEQARKRGLSLVLANQYFKQLAGDTLDAVMGNVGALIAYQCGHEDARVLAPYMRPNFEADDLVQFDAHQAAVWMRSEGQTQPAFTLMPLPPIQTQDEAMAARREAYLRQLSMQQYTPRSRAAVMGWITQRMNAQPMIDEVEVDGLYDPLH